MYPVDARGDNIAHVGGDVYGNVGLKRLGSFSYTAYGGSASTTRRAGCCMAITHRPGPCNQTAQLSTPLAPRGSSPHSAVRRSARTCAGFCTSTLKGLLAGASFLNLDVTGHGTYRATGSPYLNVTTIDKTYAFYTQYTVGNFNFTGEYRRRPRDILALQANGTWSPALRNSRQGYAAAAYRLSKRAEVGAYHSRFIVNWQLNHGDAQNHISDTTLSSKFDLSNYLDLKFEGHLIAGNMVNSGMSRGFFVAEDTNGFVSHMKMVIIKLEYHM